MSLPHTILGFLDSGPLTGYDLKKAIDSSTQFFWHAELSQIYPALKQLQASGLVHVDVQPQAGKPDKKLYSITPAGRSALRAWLSEPLDETPPTKSAVLLKLFFMGSLEKEDILAQMRCQLEAQRSRLKRFQLEARRQIDEAAPDTGLAPQGVLWDLVRQYGVVQAQASVTWLEGAIRTVEERLP